MIKNVCYGLCAIILLVMGCDQKKTYNMGEWKWKGRVSEKGN